MCNQGGAWESVTYADEVFEYHKKGSEEKNYIQLGGGIEIRIGGYSDDISDKVVYQLKDHLGSVGIRMNQSGSTIDREEYYPFGDSSLRTFTKKRYRHCGKEKDEESGLYYYGARYYMAWVGRFVSIDPLAGRYANLTPYNYGDNNPVTHFDVDGMQTPASVTTPSPDVAQSGLAVGIPKSGIIGSQEQPGIIPEKYVLSSGTILTGVAKQFGAESHPLLRGTAGFSDSFMGLPNAVGFLENKINTYGNQPWRLFTPVDIVYGVGETYFGSVQTIKNLAAGDAYTLGNVGGQVFSWRSEGLQG